MLTKDKLRAIRADIDAALVSIATKHGCPELKLGNASYSQEGSFTFKLNGVIGGGLTKEASAYEHYRSMFPKMPQLNSKFNDRGTEFYVRGLAGKSVQIERISDGKAYRMRFHDFCQVVGA